MSNYSLMCIEDLVPLQGNKITKMVTEQTKDQAKDLVPEITVIRGHGIYKSRQKCFNF